MNLIILSSALLFSSCLLRSLASADDDPPLKGELQPKMDCFPTSCGSLKNISYPFWVDRRQPPHCGFPYFKLNCTSDNIPILETPPGKFQVKEIFYSNESVWLGIPEKINGTDFCKDEYWNWSLFFSLTPFAFSSANKNLTFLFDCSEPPNDCYRIPCAARNGSDVFAYLGNRSGSSNSCRSTSVVPVVDYLGAGVSEYLELLNSGFLVNWTVADCTGCRNSSGQCGYDYDSESFMCICPDRAHARQCAANENKKSHKVGEYTGIAGGVVGGFILGCVSFILFKRRKRLQQSGSSNLLSGSASSKISSKKDHELGVSNYHTHIFSYDELQEATNGFNVSRELGDGGFGTVYKGKLRDGRTVAVKRLYEHNYRRLEQFMNEVEILSRLRHQNLVTLYGCTSRHSRELLLVYEYIPNGTVADHLHGPLASKGQTLPWAIRLSIAIETADALAYLHAVEPQIIHRDVKTTNILLDTNYHVKVADFGLSRLFPLDATHVSTAPQGTPGYVDPEYHQCYQLTDKSDVYSFGVVLVELISSKPAVDISRHRHEINLSSLALTKIQNCQVDHLVDPELGYEEDPEIRRMINQVAEVAFRCLQLDSEMRPSIKEVLEVLRGIESVGYKASEEGGDASEAQAKEECRLLKNALPCSPDSVAERWESRSTTPNTST